MRRKRRLRRGRKRRPKRRSSPPELPQPAPKGLYTYKVRVDAHTDWVPWYCYDADKAGGPTLAVTGEFRAHHTYSPPFGL